MYTDKRNIHNQAILMNLLTSRLIPIAALTSWIVPFLVLYENANTWVYVIVEGSLNMHEMLTVHTWQYANVYAKTTIEL